LLSFLSSAFFLKASPVFWLAGVADMMGFREAQC
jgi:hypothetical protein